MLRVGLTGATGAGKSTVARMLADRGIAMVYADRVAHELYAPGTSLAEAIVKAFGEGVRSADGGIDRGVLGKLVFESPDRLRSLNQIVHPPLIARLRDLFAELARDGEPVGVLEAAVLLQWLPLDFIDLVVGVTAPRRERRERLVRSGLHAEEAERRIDVVNDGDLVARARYLLINDRDLGHLEAQVDALAQELKRLASELEEGGDPRKDG